MKRLTILVRDDFSMSEIASLLDAAVEFRIDTIQKPPNKKTHHHNSRMSTQQCIMGHFTPTGEFTMELAGRWLREEEFSANSASPAISYLVRDGHLKRLSGGRYRFVLPLKKK